MYQVSGLLIVPYGIETLEARSFPMYLELLIVPYGIETLNFVHCASFQESF